MDKTHSIADKATSASLFTYDDLLRTLGEWEKEHPGLLPARCCLSPALYQRLHHLSPNMAGAAIQSFCGVLILVDPSLKHGEWRFEGTQQVGFLPTLQESEA